MVVIVVADVHDEAAGGDEIPAGHPRSRVLVCDSGSFQRTEALTAAKDTPWYIIVLRLLKKE